MYRALLVLLIATVPLLAEPPKLVIPQEIKADPGKWVTVSPDTNAKAVKYVGLDGLDAFPSSELKDGRKLIVNPTKAGRYRFVAVGTLNDEQTDTPFTIVVGNVPPTPGPGPSPEPGPTPSDPSPFSGEGVRVLILYETADSATYSKEHQAIMAPSKEVSEFLNGICTAYGTTGTKAWRVWDKDTRPETVSDTSFRGALTAAKPTGFPWLIVGNGTSGFSGPLPATTAKFKEQVQKFAK